jgi:hypothetical protein
MVLRASGGRELLVVQPDYHGPADEFAWIVPVPTVTSDTQVREVTPKLLENALRNTEPEFLDRVLWPGGKPLPVGAKAAPPAAAGEPPGQRSVRVVQITDVGPYRAALLTATGAGGLLVWLRQNGYALPPGAEPVLDNYIQRQWGFVALKLRSPAASGPLTLQPLGILFSAPRLISTPWPSPASPPRRRCRSC